MSNQSEEACKKVIRYNNGYALDSVRCPAVIDDKQLASREHPAGVVVLDNCSTLIEVTVKAKGHKRTHTMVSGTPNGEQNIEDRQKSNNIGEPPQNWYKTLRDHTRPIVKQNLQHLSLKNPQQKKISSESRDSKKSLNPRRQSKHVNSNINKHLDEIPVKQVLQKKPTERSKTSVQTIPSTVSSVCSTESILVVDRGVQCGGIFDCSNEKLSVFNPVRTLGFLMKELEDLVKDEKSSKILSDMEQALFRISTEPVKSTAMDLEALALRARLAASTAQLEEMSKRMNTLCESLREERDTLKRDVHEQQRLLEDARHKQSELESTISVLKQQLNDASKAIHCKDKITCELQQENKRIEPLEKAIAELKADLAKQTELARQRLLEMQYLMLERDKLSVLSSHKDSQLDEFRNVVKEFQNQITEQLMGLREACTMEGNSNLQGSLVQGGLACSSPSPASSDRSNVLASWQDISDVSLSTIEHNLLNKDSKKTLFKKNDPSILSHSVERDSTKKKIEDVCESRNRDSRQLEFISLPGGESTHTILFASYKEQGCPDQNETREKDRVQQSIDTESKNVGTKSSQRSVEESNEKGSYKKNFSRVRKSSEKGNRESRIVMDENSVGDHIFSSNSICSDIKKQFQHMFEDVRRKSKISVCVPSPPRHYPNPDWTDSSLPSISVGSESNNVQSNNL